MRIGAHVSAEGGLRNAPRHAGELGLECFQFFSRPPQGGPAPAITDDAAKKFLDECDKNGQGAWYIHTPYVINLASAEERIRHSSIKLIREDLERGTKLKAAAVVTHIGSASALGETLGLEKAAAGVKEITDGYKGPTRLLLELSAGAGMIIGDKLEELVKIIELASDRDIGICFDTAHAFASGYDLRDAASTRSVIESIGKIAGFSRLGLIHANDSKIDFGGRKDRHDHIGLGKIGEPAFREIMTSKSLRNIDVVLETPHDELLKSDVKVLFKMRGPR
jgi:deoxyribonuclease-4